MRLFHVSEEPDIKIFEPRYSEFYSGIIKEKVVFAISEKLIHNYLLPRDCPRLTFYASTKTTPEDILIFFGNSKAKYIIYVEEKWMEIIERSEIYCYEFPPDVFSLLDEVAGYYVSYESIIPVSVICIQNIFEELKNRKVELRTLPSLHQLAESVIKSTLNYSIIRMRNAKDNL